MTDFTLSDLESIVATRASSGDPASYTAKLAAKGVAKAAQKLGEEAVETVIAAISEDEAALASESADLLYHLLVVLHLRGVALNTVLAELERRTAETGLQEKAGRTDAPDAAPAAPNDASPAAHRAAETRTGHRYSGD